MSKICNPNLDKALDPDYICNPLTGKWIKKDGKLAKQLVKDGILSKLPAKAPAKPKAKVKAPVKPNPPVVKSTRLNDKLVEMLEELSLIHI